MIDVALALSAALAAATAAPHQTTVTHRGTAYEISYHPQVATRIKTVGMASGTRMSTERCRWTSEVRIERRIVRDGRTVAHGRLLPGAHIVEGSRPGHCGHGRPVADDTTIAARDDVRQHLAAVAERDRTLALADIDASQELATAN